MDISQAEIPALVAVGEPFVIHAQTVQECGVEVVHVHFVLLGEVAKVIGRTVDDPRPDAAASHPNGEAVRVVVAAESRTAPLRHGGSAKFSTPDHQRFVEQTPLL